MSSRDFIGSPARDFLPSPNRDRVIRGGGFPDALVAREIEGYWLCFAGGAAFGRLHSDPSLRGVRLFTEADFVFDMPHQSPAPASGNQHWSLGEEAFDATDIVTPEPDGWTGNGFSEVDFIDEDSVTQEVTETTGRLGQRFFPDHTLSWSFSNELDVESKYNELREILDGLPFPPKLQHSNPFLPPGEIGASDTYRAYSLTGAIMATQNLPNVSAYGAQDLIFSGPSKHLFKGSPGSDPVGVQAYPNVLRIRLRDVLIGSAAKTWQFAALEFRGADDFHYPSHNVVSETSCDPGGASPLLAPEYDTLVRGVFQNKSQHRVAFPAHKWTIPGPAPGFRNPGFSGLTPSCAPEVVGTEP